MRLSVVIAAASMVECAWPRIESRFPLGTPFGRERRDRTPTLIVNG
jgi:hypothetical protein